MNKEKVIVKGEIEGVPLSLETGYLAQQCDAAVKVQFGETVVLTLLTVGKPMDVPTFLPLTIEYLERMYAGGLISGSRFNKRETRPSDDETIKARLIDHATRSLFADDFFNEVQVVNVVLSYDGKNDAGTAAAIGSSAAMSLAGLPIKSPIGAVKIGIVGDETTFNLQDDVAKESTFHMYIFATKDGITSIEAEGHQIPEDKYLELLEKGFEKCQPLIDLQNEFVKKAGAKKLDYVPSTKISDLAKDLYPKIKDEIQKNVLGAPKGKMYDELKALVDKVRAEHEDIDPGIVYEAVNKVVKKLVHSSILESGKRPDGRKADDVREINCEVGVLPRTHGSAVFNRGETQCLSVITLGSTRLEQTKESMAGEETKRFMHHYNMKGYAMGEVDRRLYYPGRREVGHGAIGEKALRVMIPEEEKFPYAIRGVSEILSSNGSTSMAATCGTSMALMDAGVPIELPVAGISMGLVYDKDGADGSGKYILLSDIQGIEDGAGDMDYKVAGTEKGINAIQLDNKMGGVPVEVLKEATMKAREVRLHILSRMAEAISKSRAEMSEYAPKIVSIKINKEKIGDVIGPGGKQIRAITEETGVEINIDDEGIISIAAIDDASREKAEEIIRGIVEEAEVGKIYDGEVDRIENYGVFVTVSAGITGLLHVSEIADAYVSDVTKIFSMGDKVRVKAKDIDDAGKVALTMKGVEGNEEVQEKVKKFASSGPAPGGGRPGGDRGRSSGGRSGGGRPSYGGGRDSRSRSGDSRSRSNDRSSSRPFGKSSGSRPSSNRPSSQPSQRPQYKRDNFNSGDSKPKKRDMTDSEVADVLL